jgi:signal transduction histidine kinase
MDALVSALVDAARLRAGHLTIHPQPCDLVDLARVAAAGLSDLAAEKEIRLSLAAGAESAMAMVDPERIAQVLASLLDNAVKFTSRGGQVELRVSPVASEVHIAVVDNGPGIPRDQLSRIFERAWQVEPGQERAHGLGLTLARGIIDAHRGRIWAESQVGHGTAVRIALPTA